MLLQEVQRQGDELEKQLKALAGMKNNNPRNVPGVPYIKWQPGFIPIKNAKTLRAKCKQTNLHEAIPSRIETAALQFWNAGVDYVAESYLVLYLDAQFLLMVQQLLATLLSASSCTRFDIQVYVAYVHICIFACRRNCCYCSAETGCVDETVLQKVVTTVMMKCVPIQTVPASRFAAAG